MTDIRVRSRKPYPDITDIVAQNIAAHRHTFDQSPSINVPSTDFVVMGIDASLTNTGIAAIKNGKLYTDSLEPKKLRGVERLDWFRRELRNTINCLYPHHVMIEGYAFGAKMQREAMGELGGVVRLACLDARVGFQIVQPTSLKLFVTGKGNGPKDNMSKEIYKRFGVDLTDNNQIDAAGLAIMALPRYTDMALTEFQKRALDKIDD